MRFDTTVSINGKERDVVCIGVEDGYNLKMPKRHGQRGVAVRVKLTLDGYNRQLWKEIGYVASREVEGKSAKEWLILDEENAETALHPTRREAAEAVREGWLARMAGSTPDTPEPEEDPTEATEDTSDGRDPSLAAQAILGRAAPQAVEHVSNPPEESAVFQQATDSAALEKWLSEVPLAQTSLLEAFKAGARWAEDRLKRRLPRDG